MENPLTLQEMGKYLWYSLIGLGFQTEAATSKLVGKITTHINLGIHMFDKPNKDAFYIVTNFLLDKLDPARFKEAYRHCWPVFDRKADTEFRKITLAWLKDIVDEKSTSAPKVVASMFLSPGGPKFIALMLHLANHVMLQEMKTFATDGSWFPEEAAMPASTVDIAMKRFMLTKARFCKSLVAQDHLLQEYQRRAQTLVRSIQEIRSEGAKYDNLLKRQENELNKEWDASELKLQKVRSLWSTIDEMMAALKEEQQAVACVLKADSDQYVLDGADLALNIPRVLLEKLEQLQQQFSSGNVYEAGQLNPLCVLELMNHALQLLQEQRGRWAGHAPLDQLHPQELQKESGHAGRLLEELKVLRQKISMEGIPEVQSASLMLDVVWDRRWRDTLNEKPLESFLSHDPALSFLSPMAQPSFDPAAEATRCSGVFSCYAARLPEEEPVQVDSQAEFEASSPELNRSPVRPAPPVRAGSPAAAAASVFANSSLGDLLHTLSPPPRSPSPSSPRPKPQASDKTSHNHTGCKLAPTKNKAKILDLECDNLASQFAEAITTTSPVDKMRGLAHDDLLCKLGGDPFSTRKQLCRTPESLSRSPPAWGFPNTGGFLEDETLPDMGGSDSLLSLSDESPEDGDLLLLSPFSASPKTGRPTPLLDLDNDEASFLGTGTPHCPSTRPSVPGSAGSWLEAEGPPGTDVLFRLDLDALGCLTPTRQEYSLPELFTFSPMDEL